MNQRQPTASDYEALRQLRCVATLRDGRCGRRAALAFGGIAVCVGHIAVVGAVVDALHRETVRLGQRR